MILKNSETREFFQTYGRVRVKKNNCRFTAMHKAYRYFVSLIIVGMMLAACSKGGADTTNGGGGGPHVDSPQDTTAPGVIITTPVAHQIYSSGNIINVTGRITDDLGLYRGTISITNDANGTLLKEQRYEIHGLLAYNFNISYTTDVTVISDYTVKVTFEDHGLNTASKSVKIKVNP